MNAKGSTGNGNGSVTFKIVAGVLLSAVLGLTALAWGNLAAQSRENTARSNSNDKRLSVIESHVENVKETLGEIRASGSASARALIRIEARLEELDRKGR